MADDRGAESMTMEKDLLDLADRIERVKAYSGRDLGTQLRGVDDEPGSGEYDLQVILVGVRWRKVIADAIRSSVAAGHGTKP